MNILKRISGAWHTNPGATVITWLVTSVVVAALGLCLGIKTVIPGPTNIETLTSTLVDKKAFEAGIPRRDSLYIILESPTEEISSPVFTDAKDSLHQLLLALTDLKDGTKIFDSVQTSGHTMLGDEHFDSSSGHAALIKADTVRSIDQSSEVMKGIPAALNDWHSKYPAFKIYYLSDGTVNNEIFELINKDLDSSLIYSIPATFFILVAAFGSLVAAAVPLIIAVFSLILSLGIASFFSHIFGSISATAAQLVVLLVLAIGVDYSLFLISRIREEVRKGRSYKEAVVIARSTTGLAIFWSGIIVALSLSGLFLMRDTILASMALVSIISVLITVFGAVFVLPGLLIVLGPRIEMGQISVINSAKNKAASLKNGWVNFSIKRPIATVVLAGTFLLALSYFAFKIRLGSTVEPHLFPHSMQSYFAFQKVEEHFPELAGNDLVITLVGKELKEKEEEGEIQSFFDKLTEDEAVRGPFKTEWDESGEILRQEYIIQGSGNSQSNKDLVHRLRSELIPTMLTTQGIEASVSGTLPFIVDDSDRYLDRTPEVFGAVLALSFIFLLMAFRSVVIPLKALLLNIVSTVAAFGVLVVIFQLDHLSLFQFEVIESFVPPLLFAILFGLSMDYHVFILSRITEEYQMNGELENSIRSGIESTYKTVTSAAVIMVSVFTIIALLELPLMKELGLGLAVAVLIDATIVRCLLLPASMILLREWNWYLPKSLSRLPRFKLD